MKKTWKYLFIFVLACSMLFVTPSDRVFAARSKTPKKVSSKSVKVSLITSSSFKVKWSKAKYAKKYQVGYKKGSKWKYKTVKKTSITLTGLSQNTSYTICVKSVNGKKKSKWTKRKTVKTLSIPQEMLSQVNAQRKKAGAPALQLYNEINTTAQTKAKDMYKNGVLSHYSPTLGSFSDQMIAANIPAMGGGENIAWGQTSVSQVMNDWMHSSGHKANILDKGYTHLGVGYYKGFWVQQFITLY